ncbi:DUF4212 domain-containing protein [Pseudomonas sp. SP16.1]|uniref:DUF4212 domain-containing protein n=1 Tax=Pseudomonas sp. SP16.1 TaxID=3458854 RepID=UPI004045B77A
MTSDKANAAAYWKANVRLITWSLVVWALVSYGFAMILRPLVAGISVGGSDLGFWFAQQGSILVFIGLIFHYAWRLNRLDKEFGVEE